MVEGTLTALICGGNVLLEGVPGLGKTELVKTLSKVLDLDFSRIQFTPDLMPADIVGTNIMMTDSNGNHDLDSVTGVLYHSSNFETGLFPVTNGETTLMAHYNSESKGHWRLLGIHFKIDIPFMDSTPVPTPIAPLKKPAPTSTLTNLLKKPKEPVPTKIIIPLPQKKEASPPIWPETFMANVPQTTPDFSEVSLTAQIGQSFTLPNIAQIRTILVQFDDNLESANFADLDGSIQLEIFSSAEKSIIATTSTELSDDLGAGSILTFKFPWSIILSSGSYAFMLTSNDARIRLNTTPDDQYLSGALLKNGENGWAEVSPSGRDLVFGFTGSLKTP